VHRAPLRIERKDNDGGRFRRVLGSVAGGARHLQELITHGVT
jgi:hypothetical protein